MDRNHWTARLFQSIDKQDTEAFLGFLAGDVRFRFGNADPVNGRAPVGEAVSGFLGSIKALRHDLVGAWDNGDAVTCHGTVTYTRHDSTTLTVPFANVFGVRDGLIEEYLIFVDTSDLYTS
jgi:ketosteroid isomerase-like protein